jgi:hypothetical protein
MPIQTDLSVSPYFDDYNETKDFYKILFRPGVAVQARELNQLQTILQKQIERFGDNIFKRGTIVDGCDIKFHDTFPYVKIKDNQNDGKTVIASQYVGYYLKNQANLSPLEARVSTSVSGFESRSPDLNTLYISYNNSGYANIAGVKTEVLTFAANDILTVYSPSYFIESIVSTNDSTGFANTDSVVILPAIAIQNSTGGTTFTNNYYVNDEIRSGTANVKITAIDTTTNSEVVILKVKPLTTDLQNYKTSKWTFAVNDNITSANGTPATTANIVQVIGSGAVATVRTGNLGEVDYITVTAKGSGYYILPSVSIASNTANATQITTVALSPQNYLAQITVANTSVTTDPVGTGYGMSVGEGVIYQKGYFSRVSPQLVVVEKYSNTPDAKAVGFDTTETIINSNQDTSLLDNATGASNATAPGANRFKLSPQLITLTKEQADANSEFLYVAEFSNGAPYKQNRQTVYNIIGNELARRTKEESGNYVIDQFNLNTKSTTLFANEATKFNIMIDPGVAYINGRRIETVRNYETTVDKGIDTAIANSAIVTMNYGNYIKVNQLGGNFKFNIGAQISLYGTARTYVANGTGVAINSSLLGTLKGYARIRSLVLDSGTPGTAEAVYRLYLFDIRGEAAQNFGSVRSVLYDGTSASLANGVADAVLSNGIAVLNDNNNSTLLFSPGVSAIKNANNITYTYRTITNQSLATTGQIAIGGLSAYETFAYTAGGTLSSVDEKDIIVIPVANVEAVANISGGTAITSGSPIVTGTTTAFTTDLVAGDFIKVANSSANVVLQVNSVTNSTSLTVKTAPTSTITGNTKLFFPMNMPISLERSSRTVNVNAGGTTLTINLANTVTATGTVAVTYNVRSANTPSQVKAINRNKFVRINCASHSTTTKGPWSLGVPDVFRLRKVLIGPNTSFTETDTVNVTDVTKYFYVDHRQREDYYDNAVLIKRPNTTDLTLQSTDRILVQFDAFYTTTEGVKSIASYSLSDTTPLASSTTTINTLEIPEMYSTKGDYYDLRDQVDLRPMCVNTVALFASANSLTPINPAIQTAANLLGTDDKKFPVPGSTLVATVEYYQGRTDRVIIDETGSFQIMKGEAGGNNAPVASQNSLTINYLKIPPYPSLPFAISANQANFVDTGVASELYTNQRISMHRVTTPVSAAQKNVLQPRGYTMVDIGSLERRISDLEYYVSFTLAEVMAGKKVIPSSDATSKIDRFKFGYFVDSFDSEKYAEKSNPGYRASILNGFLSPPVKVVNIPLTPETQDPILLPYEEKVIVSQTRATNGAVYIAPVNVTGTATATATTTTVQSTARVDYINKTTARSDSSPYYYEDWYFTMSEKTGPVSLFMNCTDNNSAVEIQQSTDSTFTSYTVAKSSSDARAITTAESLYTGQAYYIGYRYRLESVGTLNRKGYGPLGGFIEDSYALTFNHAPTSGQYYRVRVYKGERHGNDASAGTYAFRLFYPVDRTVQSSDISVVRNVGYYYTYWGTILNGYELKSTVNAPYWYYYGEVGNYLWAPGLGMDNKYSVVEKDYTIKATGLKASTTHKFYLENIDLTAKCKQDGGTLGSGLQSDAAGNINFVFYYYPDITDPTSEIQKAAQLASQPAAEKAFELRNSDSTSKAAGKITVATFVKVEYNVLPYYWPWGPWWDGERGRGGFGLNLA